MNLQTNLSFRRILLFMVIAAGANGIQERSWNWSYKCINDTCVRSQYPEFVNNDKIKLNDVNICRLTCGPYGTLWPQPTGITILGKKVIEINAENIEFDLNGIVDECKSLRISRNIQNEINIIDKEEDTNKIVLEEEVACDYPARGFMKNVTQIFVQNVKKLCNGGCSDEGQQQALIKIGTRCNKLSLDWTTDESYSLNVQTSNDTTTVKIVANTIYGARHGLETLSQLISYHGIDETNKRRLIMLSEADITDKPEYPHRGLLLDTSRHYLSIDTVKKNIDAMAFSKFNVLHWHATDSHSFPLMLPRVPNLARYGAYSEDEVYTKEDIEDLVTYSKLRGIRILMEIDAPAHAGNGWQWGNIEGLGDLAVCVNEQPWRQYSIQPPSGQLNPSNPNMYGILKDLYQDLLEILPEDIFHLGADEVIAVASIVHCIAFFVNFPAFPKVCFSCWNSSKEIREYMANNSMESNEDGYFQLWSEFQNKSLNMLDSVSLKTNMTAIVWSSQLTDTERVEKHLDKTRYVIETWVEATEPLVLQLLEKGYRVIVATKDAWYLDHGFWGKTSYHSWKTVYDNRIPDVNKGVLGGEVAMWGEFVDDYNIEGRIWPRAGAAAERLWSNPKSRGTTTENRFINYRERLTVLGVRPETTRPQYCCGNEASCT